MMASFDAIIYAVNNIRNSHLVDCNNCCCKVKYKFHGKSKLNLGDISNHCLGK